MILSRETQSVWERRAPLGPQHVRKLVKKGIKVCIDSWSKYFHFGGSEYCFDNCFITFRHLFAGAGPAFQPACLSHEDVRGRRGQVRQDSTKKIAWGLQS